MSFVEQVIEQIGRIPKGKVATYGQIAALAGSPRAARTVGWILARSGQSLPWQRVVGSKGRITIMNIEYPAELQADLLKKEGVVIEKRSGSFFVNLERYLWRI